MTKFKGKLHESIRFGQDVGKEVLKSNNSMSHRDGAGKQNRCIVQVLKQAGTRERKGKLWRK